MSFNIRYGTAEDGPDSWRHRRELVRDTIDVFAPDLLGLQEALDFQVDYLREQLRGYEVVGVGREDGRRRGEFAAIFFRRERLSLARSGTFWLSETPHLPGSKSWSTSQPRIVTWCRLTEQSTAPSRALMVFNTHFDQRSEQARTESAHLLRRRLEQSDCTSIILTGDFNATEDEAIYGILRGGSAPRLMDSYRVAHPQREVDEATRHDFAPTGCGSRIDWILHSPRFATEQADILRHSFAGRCPSDHCPVTATLRWLGELSTKSEKVLKHQ